MGKIIINGITIDTPDGANVCVNGNGVFINGAKSDAFNSVNFGGSITVNVTGPIGNLDAAGSVNCEEVKGNVEASGSVTVKGNVGGDVDTSGSVTVHGDVSGDIDTSGSVTVGGNALGSIDAGGSVHLGRR